MLIHFIRPYWFLALVPMLYLCWRISRGNIVNNWRGICDPHLLPSLLVTEQHKWKTPIILLTLGMLLTVVALAGPSWKKQPQPIYRSALGSVLVLNLSASMSDAVGTTKKIDRARFKMIDFLKREKEGYTGLVVYTDEAHTISPLTDDSKTIANFVPILDPNIMPTLNDNTMVGLKAASQLLKQAGLSNGNIVLITDKVTNFAEAKRAAQSLYDEGYRLYLFDISQGMGNKQEMNKLAEAGGGKVIALTPGNQDIDTLISKTKSGSFVNLTKKTDQKGFFWQDDGRLLSFLLLPFALIAFRRGYL